MKGRLLQLQLVVTRQASHGAVAEVGLIRVAVQERRGVVLLVPAARILHASATISRIHGVTQLLRERESTSPSLLSPTSLTFTRSKHHLTLSFVRNETTRERAMKEEVGKGMDPLENEPFSLSAHMPF